MKNVLCLRSFISQVILAAVILSAFSSVLAQTPAATPAAPTLLELQTQIQQRLADPALRRGNVGVKVVSLSSGKVIFDQNAEKYFMPASNMKNFTVATAIEKLTPDYRFVTRVFASEKPDSAGTVKGDIVVRGGGDVSISYSFNDDDRFKGIDGLVDAIVQSGVKRIDGGIIGDDTYFKGSAIPVGWEWDDLQWYYGAEVSALPVNDNAVFLSVVPGPIGYQCAARIAPFNLVIRVRNRCITTNAGTPRTLRIERKLGENLIEISGNLPVGNAGFSNNITISRPAEMFASMLKQRLAEKGVVVTGQGRAIAAGVSPTTIPLVEIAKIESPPLALIAAKTMKPSQNMYTETLLWTLGENARARTSYPTVNGITGGTSSEMGIGEVKAFLTSIGIAPDGIIQYDGSGLSRHNLITPSAVVQLYTYMAKQSKYSQAWRDSLTIAGVDGTLRNRFKGTRGEANVRGKTGTIDQVSALSGYVTTAGGDQLAFSMLVNGVAENRSRVKLIDEVVLMLANFNGRLEQ
jgi:D-alanyl-D-alanine carboxypeptidase/D-alanyl-D-alanine-endopeptidase (penicillin-binding protein 4)